MVRGALACLLLLVAYAPIRAQEPSHGAPAEAAPPEVEIPTSPVEIDGFRLFDVRGVSAFPAEKRAAAIADRIRQLARDPAVAPDGLRVETTDLGSAIFAGTVRVMTVTDGDAQVEGVERAILAEAIRLRVAEAIKAYRTARTPEALTGAAWRSGAATVLLALLLFVLHRLGRRVDAVLARRLEKHTKALSVQSFELVRAERLWSVVHHAISVVRGLLTVTVVLLWARYVLLLFPWTRALGSRLGDYVFGPLATLARGAIGTIPNLFFLAILFLVTRYVLRLIRLFFDAVERGEIRLRQFEPEWAPPTYRLLRLLVIVFALVVGYPYIPGSESGAFKGLSLFLGIVFSLGSSSAIANVIAGYSLTYRRAFRVGDRVKIGNVFGDVTAIRLQVTTVRTPKNEEVIVPNSSILNQEVTNYSSFAGTHGLILHATVGIGYETPWRQVEAMLLLAAERTPGLLRDPKPFVHHKSLGDFAVNYEINVHCADPQAMTALYTELHRRILDVFNEYGVQIMTPAYEGDPEQPKIVPKDQWTLPPAQRD